MSSSDKRKGTSHAARSSAASSRSSSVIAPPPRAQLTRPASTTSSPGPEDSELVNAHSSGSLKDTALRDSMLVKDKDEKIAELRRELVVMEAEFARELGRLSRNESETASYWQAKHTSTQQQLARAEAELRLLRDQVDVREAERGELREGWEVLRRQVRERDDEVRALRGHIAGLKQWVSTSTKKSDQTSDEEFEETVAKLRNGLQNWVVSHFRKSSLIIKKAKPDILEELSELVPVYEELATSQTKPHLLQSIVSSVLVEMVFDPYFVGLPEEQASQFSQVEKFLSAISSTEAVNQWRATTMTMLRKEANSNLQEQTDKVIESVVSRVNGIFNAITDAKWTDARDQALRVLVHNSITLARLLVVQKAMFQVTMPRLFPHQRVFFDPATMDHIGAEDEESLVGREVNCITFPGIFKTGDENGSHLQYQNVIAKARVLCNAD
ncbi:hypothetical protein F5Y15DRAFT_186919 [Xylariaceae sp. FL0016]|nr:hypothetical protein F5Y15DRAFT_186919 [Xylariaceae sp. FL0016]